MSKLGALLHRAADMTHPPGTKETKFLLPKPVLGYRETRPADWVQMVQQAWSAGVQNMTSIDAKAMLLGRVFILKHYSYKC